MRTLTASSIKVNCDTVVVSLYSSSLCAVLLVLESLTTCVIESLDLKDGSLVLERKPL